MKKIFIRADGNAVLGLGHIMRCSSIAEALERKGALCCFLVADENSEMAVRECGLKALQLNSIWNDLDQEIDRMVDIIQKEKIDLLLVDSYDISNQYLEKMCQYTKVAYLTGGNCFLSHIDILINYHIYAENLGYKEQCGKNTKLILGCQFAPLRKEFSIKPVYKQEEKKIFITTGGTDPYHIVPELLSFLLKTNCMEWEYHIILGKYYKEEEIKKLDNLKSQTKNLFFYKNVKNMAEIMRNCAIAVSAAGSTLYELCACGIPTVAFAFADNQLLPLEAFLQQGLIKSAGDIRQDFSKKLQKIAEHVLQYTIDKELCIKHSYKMRKFIDGNGAEKLAEALLYEINKI